ncbi:hypothetical protein F5050DRAFT_1865286 [Lentinula boryana]|uniref:Histone deacetylase domain-containing protein n=1 Tax=Lentinula boryana TaxID=40481 RepID=A0ABQ8PZ67_9AGAR|nr:hypothetical protein F5050DRAFT_1865286 [Lentinula boryana]
MAHEFISSSPHLLLFHLSLTHLRPSHTSTQRMTTFHTDEYVYFLSRVVWELCTISPGGSIASATKINEGSSDIAINWAGGLHHANKREASGFCYINDIVRAILELLRVFPRVL